MVDKLRNADLYLPVTVSLKFPQQPQVAINSKWSTFENISICIRFKYGFDLYKIATLFLFNFISFFNLYKKNCIQY